MKGVLWVGAAFAAAPLAAMDYVLRSPDNGVVVTLGEKDGRMRYEVTSGDRVVLAPSVLGLRLEGVEPDVKVTGMKAAKGNESWKPYVGKRAEVRNRYNEMVLSLSCSSGPPMELVFRAYDEGIAFRHVLGPGDSRPRELKVIEDLSTLQFPLPESEAWSYVAEKRPKGPERISGMNGRRLYPMVVKDPEGHWLSIAEGDLSDFDNFDLDFEEGSSMARIHIDPCRVSTPFRTPWRVVMISDRPEDFVDSDLLTNLSPPPDGDFSWVKPGVSLWDWRAWGHKTKDGFTYGLDIESWKRFIDFAAEQEIPYLLLDANWYGPEHSTLSDPFKGGKAEQVKQALDYGKQKGVGLILYLNDRASVNFSIEEIAKAYADWGAFGIKYGFMKGGNQEKVRKTERVVKACAENKLLVNFHDGPIPPTGHERTWPNWNTREYVHAQSDAMRSHTPGDFVHMAYLNTIAGPIDGNHGWFDHEHAVAQRPRVFQEVESTIVAEVARTLILYSGLTVVPDSPDSYRDHVELFGFIAAQKQPWKQSRTLAGEFGKWITTARQASDGTWLVATATDESARTVRIPLDFLDPAKRYRATIFRDAEDAHFQTNRSAYGMERRSVSAGEVIEARLAQGGGHAILIEAAP